MNPFLNSKKQKSIKFKEQKFTPKKAVNLAVGVGILAGTVALTKKLLE